MVQTSFDKEACDEVIWRYIIKLSLREAGRGIKQLAETFHELSNLSLATSTSEEKFF